MCRHFPVWKPKRLQTLYIITFSCLRGIYLKGIGTRMECQHKRPSNTCKCAKVSQQFSTPIATSLLPSYTYIWSLYSSQKMEWKNIKYFRLFHYKKTNWQSKNAMFTWSITEKKFMRDLLIVDSSILHYKHYKSTCLCQQLPV